jgi:acyl-CoA reductase-like NAD-dependent aldehyde dehydrogenase
MTNPATEDTLAIFRAPSIAQVDEAIRCAQSSVLAPNRAKGTYRKELRFTFADLLEENRDAERVWARSEKRMACEN